MRILKSEENKATRAACADHQGALALHVDVSGDRKQEIK